MTWKATKCNNVKKIGFYQQEQNTKMWHRYADILVPLITLPLLVIIALYLNDYMVNDNSAQTGRSPNKLTLIGLCAALLVTSLIVFVYICTRLSAILGGRTRLRLPIIRSNRSNISFLRSINSDLQYQTPFNNYPATYESIIFDVPPYNPNGQNNRSSFKV